MKALLLSVAVVSLVLGGSLNTDAQNEVTLLAPAGARGVIEQLILGYENKTGAMVKATFGTGLGTKKQIANGEPFDVPVLQAPYQEVIASGNVVTDSATPLASVSVGVAVKKGAPKPDISTPDAVKKMLLSAKSIACPNASGGAAAGVSFEEALKRLGISEQMQPKLRLVQNGSMALQLVAKDEVEIGLTFMSEMNDPGIDVVGPLPNTISPPTVLVGFVSSHAKNPAAAKALLEYLSSPEAAAIYKAQGMQPDR